MTDAVHNTNITLSAHPDKLSQAQGLAHRFNLKLSSSTPDSQYHLHLSLLRLELQDNSSNTAGPVFVDFSTGKSEHRRRFGGGKQQPLSRAVGLHKAEKLHLIDATAGLGRDAFVLACLGCTVELVERSAILAALLEDGLARAALSTDIEHILARMQLVHADSREYLSSLPAQHADVIYMDPMYPHRSKSALVKKEMRFARDIVGEDPDASDLLEVALASATARVVVKRPKTAPSLPGPKPSTYIQSKNTRYDIYIVKALPTG